ncbi:MAG: hypothetical protein LBV51_00415 [Acholeplasmatales bacterium]|jgi:hypothetical protein|nr:hypothetical protein [Acholeplasmatales bacterium]
MNNIIYDVSFIDKFYQAEKIDSYSDLINFFISYTKDYYKSKNIYYEKYENIYIPLFFKFRLHILKARESKDIISMQNEYNKAINMLTPKIQFVQSDIDEAKTFCNIQIQHKGKTAKKDMRPIIHLNTMEVYSSMKDAHIKTGYEYNSIRRCCNNVFYQCKGQFWAYYNNTTDYKDLYESKKLNVRKGRKPSL